MEIILLSENTHVKKLLGDIKKLNVQGVLI